MWAMTLALIDSKNRRGHVTGQFGSECKSLHINQVHPIMKKLILALCIAFLGMAFSPADAQVVLKTPVTVTKSTAFTSISPHRHHRHHRHHRRHHHHRKHHKFVLR
jgi:hypothetical protein